MADDVKLRIGGDDKELGKAINSAKSKLQSLEKATGATSNKTKGFAKSTDMANRSLKGAQAASGGATNALTNLNRVVQDAPFGFMAISNNIDPLVQSFISLKNQTGSSGNALKALLGSLTGPAGILFAVSTATSLFLAFGDKMADAFSKGASAAKEAQKAFQEAIKELLTLDLDLPKLGFGSREDLLAGINETQREILDAEKDLQALQARSFLINQSGDEQKIKQHGIQVELAKERLESERDVARFLENQLSTTDAIIKARARARGKGAKEEFDLGPFPSIPGGGDIIDDTDIGAINEAFDKSKIAALTKELSLYDQISAEIETMNNQLFDQREAMEARLLAEEMAVNNANMLEQKYSAITAQINLGTELVTEFAGEIGAAVVDLVLVLEKLEDIGKSLKNIFASILRDIAAAAAKAAVLTLLFPGAAGSAGGFGDLFKSFLGIPALASGGIVKRPTTALIGESGPEAVIPLSQLGSMSAGKLEVQALRISGGDLLLTIQEAQKTRGTGSISLS